MEQDIVNDTVVAAYVKLTEALELLLVNLETPIREQTRIDVNNVIGTLAKFNTGYTSFDTGYELTEAMSDVNLAVMALKDYIGVGEESILAVKRAMFVLSGDEDLQDFDGGE